MHSKILIMVVLLFIILVTVTDALSCNGASSGKEVDYGKLIGRRWYVQYTDNESLKLLCSAFTFHRSTTDDKNLIMATYKAKDDDKAVNSTFMQYTGPGQYNLWDTSDPGFNPSQPGYVNDIGQATFTQFRSLLSIGSYFDLKTCYQTTEGGFVNYDVIAVSGNTAVKFVVKAQFALEAAGRLDEDFSACPDS